MTTIERNSFYCAGKEIADQDGDGLLIDDILLSDIGKDKIKCAANYLADLGKNQNVFANGNPLDPRTMTWKIDGKDAFELIKENGYMTYREFFGKDSVRISDSGYGLLFGLNPHLVKGDVKDGSDPVMIRTADYWIKQYQRSSNKIINDHDEVQRLIEAESKKIEKVDYHLDKFPGQMPLKDIAAQMFAAYLFDANSHMVNETSCANGVAGLPFKGDLNAKGDDKRWSIKDWEDAINAYGLKIKFGNIDRTACPDISQIFSLDFSSLAASDQKIEIGYGIITNQADIHAVPSNNSCYENATESSDDVCLYHRPHIEPVRILWKGNGWYFVKTQQEYGWIEEKNVAVAKKKDVEKLIYGEAVVRKFVFENEGVKYGMGTHLPLIKNGEEFIQVEVPQRGSDGRVIWENKKLPASDFEINPHYTYANAVNALLSETTEGIWVLANKTFMGVEGVDCSGATAMTLGLSGLLLGRNSWDQQSLAGKELWKRPDELALENQTDPEKLDNTWQNNLNKHEKLKDGILKVFEGWHQDMKSGKPRGVLLVGWKGHVGIFLGFDDNHRPNVASSLSRIQKIKNADMMKQYESTTDNVWLFGTNVTPLNTLETDPVAGVVIPSNGGRLHSWYGKISFIREMILDQ